MSHKAKSRLTVTVDPEWVSAGLRAVKAGRAASLSGWVNSALADLAAKEKRELAADQAIADYEAEFGVITDAEMAQQARADRRNAVIVRAPRRRRSA